MSSNDKMGKDDSDHLGHIDKFESIFLALAIACAFLSCIGFSLRIMDRLTRFRKAPVVTSYLQSKLSSRIHTQARGMRIVFTNNNGDDARRELKEH